MHRTFGRIASRPRWHGFATQPLRVFAVPVLIACAACSEFAEGNFAAPTNCRDNVSGETFVAVRQEGNGDALILIDNRGQRHIYRGDINITCDLVSPASGTETRQGGNVVPSRSDDGPAPKGDAR